MKPAAVSGPFTHAGPLSREQEDHVVQDRSANNGAQKREGKRELEKGKKPRIGRIVVVYRAEPHKLAKLVQYLVCIQMPPISIVNVISDLL